MRERAEAMRRRVRARLEREPLALRDLHRVDDAVTAALEPRDALLENDHDIDALHPGRTVLILLDDLAVTDALLLAVGAHLESVRSDLRSVPADTGVRDVLDCIATPLLFPAAGGGAGSADGMADLLEQLIVLNAEVLDVALAERLDQARHLHLRDRSVWMEGLAVEEAVYLPLAQRRGGSFGRRYERWHRAFSARMVRAG
jgi:hypothetical protein